MKIRFKIKSKKQITKMENNMIKKSKRIKQIGRAHV